MYIVPYQVRKTITEGIFNSVLVCHAPPRANRAQMFDTLGWMTVNELICYHTLITVFKMRSSSEPEYLAKHLKDDSRTGRLIIPNTDLGLAMKSFTFCDLLSETFFQILSGKI